MLDILMDVEELLQQEFEIENEELALMILEQNRFKHWEHSEVMDMTEPSSIVLNNIKPPYNINTLTQNAATEALQNRDVVSNQIALILKERAYLTTAFESYSFIEKIYPSDANFILIKVDDARKRYAELIKNGIVVRNRSSQFGCENCLRITVGTPSENAQLLTLLNTLK
jgi:histidinol-phosphate aminotransferase